MEETIIAVLLAPFLVILFRNTVDWFGGRDLPGRRSAGYPGLELMAVAVPLSNAVTGISGAGFWVGAAFGWILLFLTWIDLRHFTLPDLLTLPLLVCGLVAAWALERDQLLDRSLGAIAGYLVLMSVSLGYRYIRGRDGLGAGDAKLLAAGGAWVGWAALPPIVLASALIGIVWVLVRLLRGLEVTSRTALPFGPCLAAAIWLAWLWQRILW